ncbi:tyrosine-type recombinase/integrase [Actinomarinicola tropica]|uniref:tyrosine-type recombinase/integrase n=1 Tax=Actinomarinicola tropica TaxID=2789776 RepID=UPI001E34274D|nr:site-specific integrase [Actinomarinicola tropica]
MASIDVYGPDGTRLPAGVGRVPKGSRYQVRYRTPEGASRKRMFTRKVDAEQFLVSVEHRKLTGEYVDASAGRRTVRDYAEAWRAAQVQHRPTTAAQVETHLRRHVYPILGDRPIGAVRRSEIQGWVRNRSTELAPSTLGVVYGYLAAVFRAAVDDQVIARTPCTRINLPKRTRPRVVPLEVAQVDAICEALPDRYQALVTLAAATGLRQGEAFGLTVDRVDFLRRTVRVDRQLVLMPGAGPHLAEPKTPASHRMIPLPAVAGDALAAHLAVFPAGPEGFVFTNDRGEPIRRTRFSDVWRRAVARAGVEGVTFHDLRHFYASLLIRHGESVKVVQERLGHASPVETLETYAHLWPDSDDRTRSAVDSVLGAPRVPVVSEGGVM